MARKRRIWYPGAIYHVMNRGNRRVEIFKDRSDYIHFLEIIGTVSKKYAFTIHSLCLMTNHFHMAIEKKDTELWKIMQKILGSYAEDFNHRYGFNGHLFEGRYTSSLIEDERYFLEVSRYIHLNPVKARMVRDPVSYDYSSYRLFVLDESEQEAWETEKLLTEIVDTTRILDAFQDNPRERYKMFVEEKISHEEQERLIQKEMRENDMWLPVGSDPVTPVVPDPH